MERDYTERDLQRYLRGDIPAMGAPKTPWRLDFERRNAEEAQKPREIVTHPQIEKRRMRSKDGVSRACSGPPCTVCGRPTREGTVKGMHERCARKREHCPCGTVLKVTNPYPTCGKCRAKEARLKSLVGKRICTEPGCGRILNKNNTLPKCLRHAAELRSAMNTERKRQQRAHLRMAA